MAKVLARQLTIDMYKCDPETMLQEEEQKTAIINLFAANKIDVESVDVHELNRGHKTMIFFFSEGHCIIHFFNVLSYVAVDFFLCEPAASPEKLFSSLRDLFTPQKTKTTYLKRGDFGTIADMKPKIKNNSHRIRNTGAKVMKLLSHRPSLHDKF